MHNYKELEVWKKSINMVTQIYEVTKPFPDNERFGLISPMRRAAVSIPLNIAEGSSRKSNKEFSHYLSIAIGSSFELETQILIAKNLGFLSENYFSNEINEIQKMIYALIQKLTK